MTVLELVAAHVDGVGVREAARRTGIDRSAVSRILTHFDELGYVTQEGERGVYVPGPRLFSIVAALAERDSLARAAEPLLHDLVRRFTETCSLVSRVDSTFVYRLTVDGGHTLRSVVEPGTVLPLVGGAPGIAILMTLPPDERERIVNQEFPGIPAENLTDPESVAVQIADAMRLGYAVSTDRGLAAEGTVAAPFCDAAGRCAGAITLAGPLDRLQAVTIEQLGAAVRTAAAHLSERLGHRVTNTTP